jgi:YbbR domain-containing protein
VLAVLRKILFENLTQKMFALALALVLFVIKREDKVALVTATVPVRVSHPEDRVLVSPVVDKVRVTIEGKYGRLRELDVDGLPQLEINLTGNEREQLAFEPEDFKVPPGLKVRAIRPAAMLVNFEEKKSKRVPVEALVEGEPVEGYRLTSVRVEPPDVKIEGAASAVEAVSRVQSQRIDLSGRDQSTTLRVPLAPPPPHLTVLGPPEYAVTLTIEEKLGTRVITARPVEVRGVPEGELGWEVSPASVDVTLHGPVRLLQKLDAEALVAYVEAKEIDARRRGLQTMRLQFDPPEGLSLVELKPSRVTLVRRTPQAEEGEPERGPPPSPLP